MITFTFVVVLCFVTVIIIIIIIAAAAAAVVIVVCSYFCLRLVLKWPCAVDRVSESSH